MNFKACTFGRLALISLELSTGIQVGKTSLLEVNLLRRKRRPWGYSVFSFGTRQALGPHQIPRFVEEDESFFSNAKQR